MKIFSIKTVMMFFVPGYDTGRGNLETGFSAKGLNKKFDAI